MPDSSDKIFVLLSGGLDSSTVLGYVRSLNPHTPIECVTMDYGQRHSREIQAAQEISKYYDATHKVLSIRGLVTGMLVDKGDKNEEVPNVSYDDLPEGVSPTYVSFRNGLMLSVLTARAQSWVMETQKNIPRPEEIPEQDSGLRADEEWQRLKNEVKATIYLGVHADDGARDAYPDCQAEFIGPMAAAIARGTYNSVRLKAPFLEMPKSMIVSIGSNLPKSVPWAMTWSCYKGGTEHCGTCPTCRARRDAFSVLRKGGHNVRDTTKYAA